MKKFYQLNQYIKADKLRVIDEEGNQLGVLSKDAALFKARQKNLDLVLVAEKAQPPVAKIIDFQKLRYQEKKKERASKTKTQEQKEVRLTPFIADNDFEFRIKKATEFLKEGDRVKLAVKFKGVQMAHKEFGYELLERATKVLKSVAQPSDKPKFAGRTLFLNLTPIKNG